MNIKYGSGFVEGFYSNDQVQAGGLSIPQMAFGEATLAMDNEHGTLFSGGQGGRVGGREDEKDRGGDVVLLKDRFVGHV